MGFNKEFEKAINEMEKHWAYHPSITVEEFQKRVRRNESFKALLRFAKKEAKK